MVDETAGVHEAFSAMMMVALLSGLKLAKGYFYASYPAGAAASEDGEDGDVEASDTNSASATRA